MTENNLTPCWYVKDFTDGWIKFYDADCAINEAKETGAIMVYSSDGTYPSVEAKEYSDRLMLAKQRARTLLKYGEILLGFPDGREVNGFAPPESLTYDDLRVLLYAADGSLAPVNEWQPIETAPRNRTIILGLHEGQIHRLCSWSQKKERFTIVGAANVAFFNPTHWMPLPQPPKESE